MRASICAHVTIAALVLALPGACGGPGKGTRSTGAEASAASRFPALVFAPRKPTYALASARAADLVTAAREFISAVGLLADGDMADVDRSTSSEFGFNPFALDTLTAAGIDPSGSAVLFSTDFLPTFVLPVADEAKLDKFLDKLEPERGLQVRQHRGRDWFSYTFEKPMSVQWIRWDGYLAVRLNMDDKIESVAWLDDMFDEDTSLARSPVMRRAIDAVATQLDTAKLAGTIDVPGIFRAVLDKLPDDDAKKLSRCMDLLAPLSGAVALGAHLDWGAATGSVHIGLDKRAAKALREHVVQPPPGYYKLREEAGFYASLGVDMAWLEEQRAAVECPLWKEPLVGRGGTFRRLPKGLTGAFAAVIELLPSKGQGQVLGYLGFAEDSLAKAILSRIPQRRLLERKSTIAGQAVKVIALPLAPKLIYRLTDDSLLLSVGDDVMTRVLSHPDGVGPKPGLDLASLGIHPQRLAELESLLVTTARFLEVSEHFARNSYRRLKRYERGRVDVTLDGNTLVVRLDMRLARL